MKRTWPVLLAGLSLFLGAGGSARAQWLRVQEYKKVDSLAVSGSVLYAGTSDTFEGGWVIRSADGGASWTRLDAAAWPARPKKGLFKVFTVDCLAAAGSTIYAGTNAGVYISRDGGSSWTPTMEAIANNVVYCLAVGPDHLYAGGQEGVIVSADDGVSWTVRKEGWPGGFVMALAASGPNLFAGTNTGVFVSGDHGLTWTASNAGLPEKPKVSRLISKGTNVFAAVDQTGVFRSDDGGAHWALAGQGLPAAAGPTCLAVSEGTVYAGYYSKGVFASADDGRTWQALNAGWSPQIENVNLLAAGSGQLTAYVLDRGALTPAFWRLPLSGGSSAEGQESPRIYFQNGQRAYRDKDFRNAVLLFTKAIEKDPRFVDAYLQRAWADLGLGGKAGFESAAADAAKVIELDPSRKEVHFARGKAYMGEASLAPSANRRAEFMALIDKALADYQIALDADPGSVVIQIDMGQAHFAKGDLDRALAAFSSVYEKKREEPGLEPSLKALFGEFERRKRSIDCGNAVQTWVLAGQFYHDRGRYDETIRCYSRAIDLGLTGRSIFMSRGSVYGRLGDFAHAIADADMDIKLNADEFSYGFRGQIRERMGDLDKAIQDLSEAIRIRSKKEGRDQVFKYSTGSMPDLLITRARLYGEKGAWGQAVEDLLDADKRLLSGPPKAEVEKQLADAYRSKGDTKNAEKFLKKAQALKTGLK